MKIKEIANLFGITENKIRFYEKKGIVSYKRDESGYRVFDKEDVLKLQIILTYRSLEVSLQDIKRLLEESSTESLIHLLFDQWKMVNSTIRRYRNIRSAIDVIIDEAMLTSDYNQVNEEFLAAAEKIGRNSDSQWKDQWNFDDWASTYDSSVQKEIGAIGIYKNYDLILDRVCELCESDYVLDIGVGTGNLSKRLLKKDKDVIGVDQSKNMLIEAKKKLPSLKLRLGEFLDLPFKDQTFSGIVSTYAFHHLTDSEKESAFDEMFRVLTDNGELVIGDMMFLDDDSRRHYLENANSYQVEEVEDEYYSNVGHLKAYVEKKGCQFHHEQVDELMHIVKIKKGA